MAVSTYEGRLYGVPLYADVSALFYNKDLFQQAGLDPNKPPTSLAEIREYADKITALGGDVKGYFLPGACAGCNIFTVGPADVGQRRHHRARRTPTASRCRARASRRSCSGRAT